MGRILWGYSWMIFAAAALRAVLPLQTTWIRPDIIVRIFYTFQLFIYFYIVAAIPIFLMIAFAEYFSVKSKYYYLLANFIVSFSYTLLLYTSFTNGISISTANYLNYGYFEGGFPFVFSGTISALVYWYISGKYAGQIKK